MKFIVIISPCKFTLLALMLPLVVFAQGVIQSNNAPVLSNNTIGGSVHVTVNNLPLDITYQPAIRPGVGAVTDASDLASATELLVRQIRQDKEFTKFLLQLTGAAGALQVPEALAQLESATKKGSGLAALMSGVFANNGWGGKRTDEAEAHRLITLAADRGVTGAQTYLIEVHWTGRDNFPKDLAKSNAYAEKLIKNENVERSVRAQMALILGNRNILELGPKPSICEGFRLITLSASLGNGEAMRSLGYERANQKRCFPIDPIAALSWFEKGAAAGDKFSAAEAGKIYQFGFGVPRDFKAAERYYQIAETPFANRQLGWIYGKGLTSDGQPDYLRSFSYSHRAADAGEVDAMVTVGLLFEYGLGVVRNVPEAFRWYSKAASDGNERAKLNQAVAVMNGCVSIENMPLWLEEAIRISKDEKSDVGTRASALFHLGRVNAYGLQGRPVDETRAIDYFQQSCKLGRGDACLQAIVRQVTSSGTSGMQQAAERDSKEAAKTVGNMCALSVVSVSKDPDTFP